MKLYIPCRFCGARNEIEAIWAPENIKNGYLYRRCCSECNETWTGPGQGEESEAREKSILETEGFDY